MQHLRCLRIQARIRLIQKKHLRIVQQRLAMASRCTIPREKVRTRSLRRAVRPTRSSISAMRGAGFSIL